MIIGALNGLIARTILLRLVGRRLVILPLPEWMTDDEEAAIQAMMRCEQVTMRIYRMRRGGIYTEEFHDILDREEQDAELKLRIPHPAKRFHRG